MTREEEIKQASEEYYNKVKYLSDLSATPINAFKVGAEWADKTMIDKACELLVNCIEDFMLRRMEIWDKECKKQTLENIRKKLEE